MSKHPRAKTIKLEGFWTPQDAAEFDADFKATLYDVQSAIPVVAFCPVEGAVSKVDFYQVDLKRFTPDKAVGIVHVTVVDRLLLGLGEGAVEKHKNASFGFALDRKSGNLLIGRGFLRT